MVSGHIDASSLQWSEQHWIAYRDAESDLQAWIAGKTHADKAARAAAFDVITNARTEELKHIAQDGTAGGSPAAATSTQSLPRTYAALRTMFLQRKDAQLTAALIRSQRAWLEFSELQADYEKPGGAYDHRIAQLEADAKALDIDLSAEMKKIQDEPEDGADRNTEVSPDGTFRIEMNGDVVHGTLPAVVISNATGEQAPLPVLEDEKDTQRTEPTVAISDFSISPDGKWIFRTQKFYHGMCGAYLYHCVSGLKYRAATREPIDILAWKFFQKAMHVQEPDAKEGGVIRAVRWESNNLRLSLNAGETLLQGLLSDWRVDYDLNKGTFSIPASLRADNAKAYDPNFKR